MTYRLQRDRYNWMLQEHRTDGINPLTKEPAKPRWVTISYQGRLEHIAADALNEAVKIGDGTLQEQIAAIPGLIRAAVKTLTIELKTVYEDDK